MNEATKPLDKAEIAAALGRGGFASPLEKGAPLAVVSAEPHRLIYATTGALELFGLSSRADLEAMLVGSQSPGARRLRRLAAAEALTHPRLEQLRFFAGGAPLNISLTTGHVLGPGGEPWLVVTAPGPSQSHEPSPQARPAAEASEPAPPSPVGDPVRFLWATDSGGHITFAGPELADRLGANAPAIGETVDDLAARTGMGPLWPEALAMRRTFSSLRLEWPHPTSPCAHVVKLSAAPEFDPAKDFVGFRGFGVLTGESAPTTWKVAAPAEDIHPVELEAPSAPSREEATPAPRPGAEIFMLRSPPLSSETGANIVPIRPGALNASGPGGADSVNPNASVELTTQERDAFREIARALGARRSESAEEAPAADLGHDVAADLAARATAPNFVSLIDALPVGALIVRGDETLFANRTLLAFAGYASLEDFTQADGLNKMFRGRSPGALLADGADAPVVAADDELVIVHGQTSEIDWDGGVATLVSLRRSREVEHQETALGLEAEARASSQRAREYLTALDVAADGFVRLDANGRILMMSPRAEALFGYLQQEAAGANFLTLLSPQSQGPALSAFLRAMGPKASPEGNGVAEGQARGANGRVFSCRMRFGRLAATDPAEAYLLVEDREEAGAIERGLEAARQEALRANERKTEFLALVSHEIRTPLQAILGFAEVMIGERFGPVGNDRYKDYLKDIHASGMHVISLANDLIDLAKIEAGKMELVFEPVDANRIIRDCVALMQPQAARERIIMRLSLSEKLPNVMADERSLRQIMLNLMSNAVKFNEPGGQVIVSTAIDDAGAAVIRVRDTGVGMNDGELALALEPFRRAENGKLADGSGLGLPLTKALVEANHADFSIKSRKEQGTLVEVAFSSIRAAQ